MSQIDSDPLRAGMSATDLHNAQASALMIPVKAVLKTDWLHGAQMEGFKPCPFCGELPFIKVDPKAAGGFWTDGKPPIESVWVWLICKHWGGDISYQTNRSCYYIDDRQYPWKRIDTRTVEEASREALEDVRKHWNERKGVHTTP